MQLDPGLIETKKHFSIGRRMFVGIHRAHPMEGRTLTAIAALLALERTCPGIKQVKILQWVEP